MDSPWVHSDVAKKIGSELAKYFKQKTGKGPTKTETCVMKNLVIVKLSGCLLPAEKDYTMTDKGSLEIKLHRIKLTFFNRDKVMELVSMQLGRKVENMFYDLDPDKDEGYMIFVYDITE